MKWNIWFPISTAAIVLACINGAQEVDLIARQLSKEEAELGGFSAVAILGIICAFVGAIAVVCWFPEREFVNDVCRFVDDRRRRVHIASNEGKTSNSISMWTLLDPEEVVFPMRETHLYCKDDTASSFSSFVNRASNYTFFASRQWCNRCL